MRISDLELFLVEIARTGPLPPVRSLLVRLTAERRIEGWGESGLAWRPTELSARRDSLLPVLIGRSVFDIEELHTLESLKSAPLRASIEMACWDLAARAAGQPLCRLLGGEYRRRIPLAVRLAGRETDRTPRIAREMDGLGFHAQIINSTGVPELDHQLLLAVRERVGDHVQLRLDAQAGYTADGASDLCGRLDPRQLQFVLDPLRSNEIPAIASLERRTSVPLGVWRSIRHPTDVLALVQCRAASYVVLDSEQLGGISPARTCATIAGVAGVSALLGGRPSLGIAAAAMLHLAAATPGLTDANESAYHQLSNDILTEPLAIADGMMSVPQGPGLGIEVDRAKVERYAVG